MISVRDAELAKTIGRNITKRLIEKDKTQQDMCNDLGWKKGTVSAWVNGTRMPKMDKIDIMCKYFGCERDDLLFDAKEMKMMRSVSIPVYARVAAGIPLEASEEIVDREEIPKKWTEFGDYYGLRIRGDSMQPRIEEGDVVIVRKQSTADDGQTVIAIVNGNDAVCKKLKVYKDGIALVSNNPIYAPMYFSASDTQDIPVRIIGRVVEIRGKL
jgi:repressor LexA